MHYSVQRLRGGFALVWKEGDNRRRRQLAARDRPSAEAEARRLWDASATDPWTVGRCMAAYLTSIEAKPSHQRRTDAWKAMRAYWNDVDPALIDEQMARDYASQRRAAPATTRYELLQLSTALRWARGQGWIAVAPPIWLPSPPERKLRHLSRSEFETFFAAVRADHARLYVMLGLHTCARPSSILELTWDRVDFMRRQIDFAREGVAQTKKRRGVVPIADTLLPWLQRAHRGRTGAYVIEHGGQPVASIKKAFQAASKRSGVHATPYTLRHTGAVWAAEAGVPMSELAQFMGHDDDRTTQKFYARYSPDHLRSVADAIGRGSL